jgi:molybdenum cofactor biosynthesis enzyme MoaA
MPITIKSLARWCREVLLRGVAHLICVARSIGALLSGQARTRCGSERPETDASLMQASALPESGEVPEGAVRAPALPAFNNIPASLISSEEPHGIIPGRADLRISLTSECNLQCSYCHNEGQEAPWHKKNRSALLSDIEKLLEVAAAHGARSVKFSGGDPGMYPDLAGLLEAIAGWRERYPGIVKWGMATNGVPFCDARKFQALVASRLDNISIGIDSVEPEELSKRSSPVGIHGQTLIDQFVRPLVAQWKERNIKFDTVFEGEQSRTLAVIRAARELVVDVSIVEVNGVMGNEHPVRNGFLELIRRTAAEFGLQPRLYEPLNEIYLYDSKGNTPIKFYQDHCREDPGGRDCGNCRKIHLRVSPTTHGWGAVPCFLQAQSRTIPLVVDGHLSETLFKDAIRYNGRGPRWFNDTPYGPATRSD